MRLCKEGWLQTYLEYTELQESPEIFHVWAGMSVISGALGRNCFIRRGYWITYPNQYIFFISDSAKCNKSTAAEIALSLYNEAIDKRPVIDRKPSMQKLIKNLGGMKKSIGYSFFYLYNSELSTLFGRGNVNTDLMDFVTARYMCTDYLYETLTRGDEWVREPYINLLSCTTPHDLGEMPPSLVGGGLAGRIMFIYSSTPRAPLHDPSEAESKVHHLRESLIHDLKEMDKIQSEYKMIGKANAFHKVLYEKNYYRTDLDFRLRPYQGRYGEHVIKVGMLIAASRHDTPIIEKCDLEAADAFLKQMEANVLNAFVGVGYDKESKNIDRVVSYVRNSKEAYISHTTLLKKMYRYGVNSDGLNQIMDTLREANVVTLNTEQGRRYKMCKEED